MGVQLLRKAASQDHKLAASYLKKMDVIVEKPEKLKDAYPAAGQVSVLKGDEEVMKEARQYYTGIGRTKDYGKAYSMLLPLAKGGYPEAARLIGLMKLFGKGTEKNSDEAKQWLSVAAQKEDPTAIRMLEQYKSLF